MKSSPKLACVGAVIALALTVGANSSHGCGIFGFGYFGDIWSVNRGELTTGRVPLPVWGATHGPYDMGFWITTPVDTNLYHIGLSGQIGGFWPSNIAMLDLAAAFDGTLYGTDGSTLYRCSPWGPEPIGPTPELLWSLMYWEPDKSLYSVGVFSTMLYRIDPVTAAWREIGLTGIPWVLDLEFFIASTGGQKLAPWMPPVPPPWIGSLYSIDHLTGASHPADLDRQFPPLYGLAYNAPE